MCSSASRRSSPHGARPEPLSAALRHTNRGAELLFRARFVEPRPIAGQGHDRLQVFRAWASVIIPMQGTGRKRCYIDLVAVRVDNKDGTVSTPLWCFAGD